MTMTDDELLARLKQRARELRATHAHAEENRDGWFATMPPEIGEAWLREAALLDRVIEIIERHRAEGERLTQIIVGKEVALGLKESALAAERRWVGEFQTALEEIAFNTSSLGDALDTACNALQRKRAALAGKEPA